MSALFPSDTPPEYLTLRHVLVADEDPEQRAVTCLTLRGAGFDVTEAKDGLSLVELLANGIARGPTAKSPYDLVVAAVAMRAIDPLALLFRAPRLFYQTKVVFTCHYPDPKKRARALALGAAAFLEPPQEAQRLLETVCALTGRKVPQRMDA